MQEKLKAVMEFEGLEGEKQGEYLRREGLHSEHIAGWKKSMEAGLESGSVGFKRSESQRMGCGQEKDQGTGGGCAAQGSSVGGDDGAVGAEKKSRLDLGQRGERVSVEDRQSCIEMVQQAKASGARRQASCEMLEVSLRTVERWEKAPEKGDQRRGPVTACAHALSAQEKQAIVKESSSAQYRDLSPWQMVARLADGGRYLGSESSFYRVLK